MEKTTETNVDGTIQAAVETVRLKKEIKARFKNGESLRKISKDKGLEIVLPL